MCPEFKDGICELAGIEQIYVECVDENCCYENACEYERCYLYIAEYLINHRSLLEVAV